MMDLSAASRRSTSDHCRGRETGAGRGAGLPASPAIARRRGGRPHAQGRGEPGPLFDLVRVILRGTGNAPPMGEVDDFMGLCGGNYMRGEIAELHRNNVR